MKIIYHFSLQKEKKTGKFPLLVRILFVFLCCLSAMNMHAQQKTNIAGVITDANGEPIIGATIVIGGQGSGTISDVEGKFSIPVLPNEKITVSYIGYLSQTIDVAGRNFINVVLQEDFMKLDEIVVIGYGAVKKRDLTGAVSSVRGEDITLNPGIDPMQALQGRVAGLDITKESGQPGEGVTMQLRGNRSFTADSAPLFIIDGLPGDYTTLNPNDIESIEVLKDASSSSVYGSSGANGIVIITTKKAKEGKPLISLSSYIGLNGWSKVPKVRSGDSYINTLREANAVTGNWNSVEDDSKLFSNSGLYEAYMNNKWIDWADEALKNGYQTNTSLSISGGSDRTKAYLSLNFSDEVGQYANDNYKLYSTKINVDHKINNWISGGISLQASYSHQNKRGAAKLDRALAAVPLGEVYDENGAINVNPIPGDDSFISILADEQSGVYKNRINKYKLYVNPYLELKPIKGLSILSRLNGTLNVSKNNYFQGEGSYNYLQNGTTYATIADNKAYEYTWENIATYNFNINSIHDFTVTGVTSWKHNQSDYDYMYGENITDNKYLWYNLGSATNLNIDSSYKMRKAMAYVGRINYSYLERYLFSASIRYEADSRLSEGHRWHSFPGLSAGWRIYDEPFMQSTKDWLSNMKLRVSWGVTGTANLQPFQSIGTLEQSYLSIGNTPEITYFPSEVISNPLLGWEKSYSTDIGLDIGFLKGRIDLNADFYITNTKDIIYNRTLPVTSGAYSSSKRYYSAMNLYESKNTGFEITLNTHNIITKDFTWSSAFTFATNKEKITKLLGSDRQYINNAEKGNSLVFKKGEALYSYYNYKLLGVWQKGEEADAAAFGRKPGDYKIDTPSLTRISEGIYVDTEGNRYSEENPYTYGADDYQILGHSSPDWSAGFQNTLTYKNFDFTIYLYARWGQMIKYDLLGSYDPSGVGNFPEYFNYWTEYNPANDFPAINANEEFKNYEGYYARPFIDGSFFKIKNITLGYTLPASLLRKFQMTNLRVYGTITNPFVYAKSHLIKDYDPEMNGSISYPLTKQLVFGINLTF